MRRRIEDGEEPTFTQKSIEFGTTLFARLVAHQRSAGFRTFAEFIRFLGVDYLKQHGDAVAMVPATRKRFFERVAELVATGDGAVVAEKLEAEFSLVFHPES